MVGQQAKLLPLLGAMRNRNRRGRRETGHRVATPLRGDEERVQVSGQGGEVEALLPLLGAMRNVDDVYALRAALPRCYPS